MGAGFIMSRKACKPRTLETVARGSSAHELRTSPSSASRAGATIHATSTGAALDFQCMHADASALVVDGSGAFEGQGTLSTTGGVLTSYPDAKFTGTVSGDTLTLTATWQTTVTTSTGTMPYTETYGPVTFTKNLVPKRRAGCI